MRERYGQIMVPFGNAKPDKRVTDHSPLRRIALRRFRAGHSLRAGRDSRTRRHCLDRSRRTEIVMAAYDLTDWPIMQRHDIDLSTDKHARAFTDRLPSVQQALRVL